MENFNLDEKLKQDFAGRIVRKDLTNSIKEGLNVPIYVLEYLLGSYCSTDDEQEIEEGVKRVKSILYDNFVRPDEAERIKSKIKENGIYKIIDKITAKLNFKKDRYEAEFSNLGIKGVTIGAEYVTKFEKLLGGGIWCIVDMEYFYEEAGDESPFIISSLKPIQLPNVDINEIKENRKNFTKDEWIDVLIRSTGMEPSNIEENVRWHLLERLVPLVENNYNLCELGPRSTGKSHVYKEISPNSILVSGGQTTVANLFFNMSTKKIGLVGLWDTVAFDEVAGIKFKDKDGIQIMKDYMNSGSFVRGSDEKQGTASMVFVGNVNQSIDSLVKTSHLFAPFPPEMSTDSAFFDRMHYYLPGWEMPKLSPKLITDNYGFIVDYLAEFFREMRKISYSDAFEKYYKLGSDLNQRDVTAVRKTISGLTKLIYPDGNFEKEDIEEILKYALVGRRRVKEQLKKIGGMEFYDVHFSYLDRETNQEEFVSVPEMGGGKLIPNGKLKPGDVYVVGSNNSGMKGVYKLENSVSTGNGKFTKTSVGNNSGAKESIDIAFRYFGSNHNSFSSSISVKNNNFLMQISDLQGYGLSGELAIGELVGLVSAALGKSVLESLAIMGNMTVSGTIPKIENFADAVSVAVDAGARKILIPASSVADYQTIPQDLIVKFTPIFYSDPIDAAFKAMGVE
ncbi:protease Lon-related BREX system protein BrxL [Geotoga petraea]|uniref:ATP-dependent Lon protease n=1 Tax=Geotoga petraea TaxID=28234 RepID=A0A1G6MLM1_9BACT|nr:protease Lon-related BREX system protein BrxL [Geotoga petraea]SDC56518.1 ATP-dependent Lon protease [Geotoga petraea]